MTIVLSQAESEYRKLNSQRLDQLWEMYQNPKDNKKLNKEELSELRRGGYIKDPMEMQSDPHKGLDLISRVSQRKLAELISRYYEDTISPMQITRAYKKGAPGRAKNGSCSPVEFIKWYDVNERAKLNPAQSSLHAAAAEADLNRKIYESNKARMEMEETERELSDKWMLTSEHVDILKSIRPLIWDRFVLYVEKEQIIAQETYLKTLMMAPEVVTQIVCESKLRHKAGIDSLQREFQDKLNAPESDEVSYGQGEE